jgi:hypothetical protein
MTTVTDVCTSLFALPRGRPAPSPLCAARAAGSLPGGLAGAGATGGWHPVVQGGRQGGRAQSVEKAV